MAVNNNQLDHHNGTASGDKSSTASTTPVTTMTSSCPQVTHSRARTSTIINTSLSPTPPVADLTGNFDEENYKSKSGNSKYPPLHRPSTTFTNCTTVKPGDTSPVDDDVVLVERTTQSGNNNFNDLYDDAEDATVDEDTFPDMLRVKSEEYSKRIAKLQEEYLIPLKEDLADWINRITESTFHLTPENFMDKLDNGVIICKLAKLIESQVDLHPYTPVTATATVNANCNLTTATVTSTILPSKSTTTTTTATSPEAASNLHIQPANGNSSTAVTTSPSDLLDDVKQVPINDSISNGHLDVAVNGGSDDDSCLKTSSSSPSVGKSVKKQQEPMAALNVTGVVVVDEVNANGNKEDKGDTLEGECSVTLPPTPKPRGINHQRVSSSSSVSSCISSSSTSYNLLAVGGCASPAFNGTSSSSPSASSSASPSSRASPAVGHLPSQLSTLTSPSASNCFLNCQQKVPASPFTAPNRNFTGSGSPGGVTIHPSGSIKLNHRPNGSNCSSSNLAPKGLLLSGSVSSSVFKISSVKCWEGAKSQSFYARDNVSNFIKWCRYLGVREAVIFETEDLVLHNNQRNVVLCLLEVARIICTKYGFTIVPGLVALEKEIDQEIEREELQTRLSHSGGVAIATASTATAATSTSTSTAVGDSCDDHLHRLSIGGADADAVDASTNCDLLSHIQTTDSSTSTNEQQHSDHATGSGDLMAMMKMLAKSKDGQSDDHQQEQEQQQQEQQRQQPGQHLMAGTVKTPSPSASLISLTSNNNSICSPIPPESITNQSVDSYDVNAPTVMASQLDQKVMLIAKSFYGKKAKQGIQRLEEGKYRIAGKIVFVRLLRDRHVMIRIGGGWDTLQHFLERHGLEEESPHDISPSDLLPMDTRPSETKRRSTNSLRHSMSGSPSILNSSYNLHQASQQQNQQQHHQPNQPQVQQLQYTDNGTNDFKEQQHQPQQHSHQQPSQLVTAEITQVTSKSIALPPGTALLSVVPKSPSSVAASSATIGSGLLRSPSASLVPVPRRCLNSTPVSRRSSISSPEPWTHCTSGSSGIGSTASSSGGEPSSPSTVGGHSSVSSSRASNHSANGFTYSPESIKQQQQHLPSNKKSSLMNRRSSISGCSLSGLQNGLTNGATRIPGMNDISRTSSFTNSPAGNKLMKRRSLDAGSNRNLMNRSFLALNGKGSLGQQCPPSLSSSTRSLIPTPVSNKSRYINYLASSQHITNSSNTSVNGSTDRSGTNAPAANGKATCVKDLINGNSVLTNSFTEANTLLPSIPKRTTVN